MKMFLSFVKRLLVMGSLLAVFGEVRANGYDPLAMDPAFHATHVDLSFHDAARNRDIPLRIYLSANTVPEPVVLFIGNVDVAALRCIQRCTALCYVTPKEYLGFAKRLLKIYSLAAGNFAPVCNHNPALNRNRFQQIKIRG